MNYITLSILLLIITILIEWGVVYFFIRKDLLRLFLYVLLINSFTLPIATYFYQNILNNLFFIECMVLFVESFLIMWLLEIKYKKALLISFVANFITFLIGLVISFCFLS